MKFMWYIIYKAQKLSFTFNLKVIKNYCIVESPIWYLTHYFRIIPIYKTRDKVEYLLKEKISESGLKIKSFYTWNHWWSSGFLFEAFNNKKIMVRANFSSSVLAWPTQPV